MVSVRDGEGGWFGGGGCEIWVMMEGWCCFIGLLWEGLKRRREVMAKGGFVRVVVLANDVAVEWVSV